MPAYVFILILIGATISALCFLVAAVSFIQITERQAAEKLRRAKRGRP